MGRKKRTPDTENGSVPTDNTQNELLEKIRRLEEENKRLGEENESYKDEIQRIEKENKRLGEEIEIFRDVLKMKGLDPDSVIAANKDLLRRVRMNSTNSSKPPSSDGYGKPSPKSLRVKTGRKPGGQPGHKGHSVFLPHEPDEFVDHYPKKCESCPNFGKCRENSLFERGECRYVTELEIRVKVTEHRSFRAKCPKSSEKIRGTFPDNVSARIRYGDSFAILAGVLDSYGYISDKRCAEIIGALTGTSISPATIEALTGRCAQTVRSGIARIREKLTGEEITHHDETGVRVNGILSWVHNTSTPEFTVQTVQTKRGKEGMELHGAVPKENGISVHDCWAPYFGYGGKHAICCAHILRELNGAEEAEPGNRWIGKFRELLLSMKSSADGARACGMRAVGDSKIENFSGIYDGIMELAREECPLPEDKRPNGRGRRKKGKERSLIERLMLRKDCIFMFVRDLRVPFDNNQAERDVRYIKVKSKVSGGFRSLEKTQEYLDVSSYLGTARKNGIGVFEALRLAFEGKADTIVRAIFSARTIGGPE